MYTPTGQRRIGQQKRIGWWRPALRSLVVALLLAAVAAAVANSYPGPAEHINGTLSDPDPGAGPPANQEFIGLGPVQPDPGEEEGGEEELPPGDGGTGGNEPPAGTAPSTSSGDQGSLTAVVGSSRPVVTIDRVRRKILRRTKLIITGTAGHESGIVAVRYSLAYRHGKSKRGRSLCRYLKRKRRFTKRRWSCRKARRLRRATGTTSWKAILPRRLPRGRYILAAQAKAGNGQLSKLKRVRFRVVRSTR